MEKIILKGRFYQFGFSFALWEGRKYFVNYDVIPFPQPFLTPPPPLPPPPLSIN